MAGMAESVMGRAPAGPVVTGSNKRLQLVVVALVLLSAVGYLVYSGLQTNVYYQTVGELRGGGTAAAGRPVRVAGLVDEGSIVRQEGGSVLRFSMSDDSGSIPVVYKGAVPDIFQPGIEVVIEGKYAPGGEFTANTLLAKCPSKFDTASEQ
jgi:cytochrome c-type biogenesis protein CcmE